MANVEDRGDWIIWHDPLPVEWRGADWHYARKLIGQHADPELNHGSAESREMCLQIIDYIEQDETPEAEERHSKRGSEAFDRLTNVPLVEQLAGALFSAKSVLAANGRGFADGVHHARIASAVEAYQTWKAERESPL